MEWVAPVLIMEMPASLDYFLANQESIEAEVEKYLSLKGYVDGDATKMIVPLHEILMNIGQHSTNGQRMSVAGYDRATELEIHLKTVSETQAAEIYEKMAGCKGKHDALTDEEVADSVMKSMETKGCCRAGLGSVIAINMLDRFEVRQLEGKEIEYVLTCRKPYVPLMHSPE